MTKKIFISLVIIILIAVFGVIKDVRAGVNDNVWGWAWTGDEDEKTIGWISFNCNNPELPAPQCSGNNNYGVHICVSESDLKCAAVASPKTGKFIGYAHFDMDDPFTGVDEIGWIDFAPAGPYPSCPVTTCPAPAGSPDYSARADLACPGNQCWVTGWARALNYNGGWDGWILLGPIVKGGTDYGTYIDNTLSPNQFKGWAWGDTVVGWISFNCSNRGVCSAATGEGGPSDYKVMGDLNPAPTVTPGIVEIRDGCGSNPLMRFNWTFNDPGDTQSRYEIQIDDDQNRVEAGEPVPPFLTSGDNDNLFGEHAGLSYNTPYYWWVRVRDFGGKWSGWTEGLPPFFPFNPGLRWPNTIFSASPSEPRIEEVVIFDESSKCYSELGCETMGCNCTDDPNIEYSWDFGDGVTSNIVGDATHDYSIIRPWTVWLSITDSISGTSRTCSKDVSFTVRFPLPRWREIVPF